MRFHPHPPTRRARKHRGHRGHRGHRPPAAASRRARLEAYQRDLEQELADVAEQLRRIDEES